MKLLPIGLDKPNAQTDAWTHKHQTKKSDSCIELTTVGWTK